MVIEQNQLEIYGVLIKRNLNRFWVVFLRWYIIAKHPYQSESVVGDTGECQLVHNGNNDNSLSFVNCVTFHIENQGIDLKNAIYWRQCSGDRFIFILTFVYYSLAVLLELTNSRSLQSWPPPLKPLP